MGFLQAIKICLNKYAVFSGRARRKEYWFFCIFITVVLLAADIAASYISETAVSIVTIVIIALTFLPTLSCSIRRMHDTGRSGKLYLYYYMGVLLLCIAIAIVSLKCNEEFVGWFVVASVAIAFSFAVVLFIFLCQNSQEGENKYGENPKGKEAPKEKDYTTESPNAEDGETGSSKSDNPTVFFPNTAFFVGSQKNESQTERGIDYSNPAEINKAIMDYSKQMKKRKIGRTIGLISLIAIIVISIEVEINSADGIGEASDNIITVSDLADLTKYYGEDKVTKEDVQQAIRENENLEEKYKVVANRLLDELLRLEPNADLRIYYENMKDISVEETTKEQIEEQMQGDYAGYYTATENKIYVEKDIFEQGIYHEFAHAAHNYWDVVKQKGIKRCEEYAGCLEEGMTNYLVRNLARPSWTYTESTAVVQYLINMTDYKLSDYNRYGIGSLIECTKQKYPELDIEYVIKLLEEINETSANLETRGNINSTEKAEELYERVVDELFCVCLAEMTKDNALDNWEQYGALSLSTLSDSEKLKQNFNIYYDTYCKRYEKDVEGLDRLETILDVPFLMFMYDSGTVYPITSMYNDYAFGIYLAGLRENGKMVLIENYNASGNNSSFDYINCYGRTENRHFSPQYIKRTGFCDLLDKETNKYILPKKIMMFNPEFDFSNEAWFNFLSAAGVLTPMDYSEIPITDNGKELANLMINDSVTIEIGFTQSRDFGYRLFNGEEELYRSEGYDTVLSNRIPLYAFLIDYPRTDRIELNEVFCDEYLNDAIDVFYYDCPSVGYKKGELASVMPCKIVIDDSGKIEYARNIYMYYSDYDGTVFMRDSFGYNKQLDEYIQFFTDENHRIVYFDDVLRSLNIPMKDESCYTYSELLEMFNEYFSSGLDSYKEAV